MRLYMLVGVDISGLVAVALDSLKNYGIYFHRGDVLAAAYQCRNHISAATRPDHKDFWILHHPVGDIMHPSGELLPAADIAIPCYDVGSRATVDEDFCHKTFVPFSSFNNIYSGKRVPLRLDYF